MNIQKLDSINKSRTVSLVLFLLMFAIMLVCNMWTAWYNDDYEYLFSYADGTRIEHISDIFLSMKAHRNVMNGRLVSHFLLQLSLLLPPIVFKLINSLMMVAMVLLIYGLAVRGKARNNLLLATIFGAMWVMMPAFGQAVLWQAGSVNYLWSGVFSALCLWPFINQFIYNKNFKNYGLQALYVLFSMLVGAYAECSATALIFLNCMLLVLSKCLKRQRIPLYMYLALLAMVIGYLFMITAPGEVSNKANMLNLGHLLKGIADSAELYRQIWILLALYLLLALFAAYTGADKDRQILALLLMLGSLISVFVLAFANGVPDRCACIGTLLAIAACAVLYMDVYNGSGRLALVYLSSICLVATLYSGCIGLADIYDTYTCERQIEQYILDAKDAGEMDVAFRPAIYKTKYSAGYDMLYISADSRNWPNTTIAKYYGVDSVSAIYD